jgi:hypothetical protein
MAGRQEIREAKADKTSALPSGTGDAGQQRHIQATLKLKDKKLNRTIIIGFNNVITRGSGVRAVYHN